MITVRPLVRLKDFFHVYIPIRSCDAGCVSAVHPKSAYNVVQENMAPGHMPGGIPELDCGQNQTEIVVYIILLRNNNIQQVWRILYRFGRITKK